MRPSRNTSIASGLALILVALAAGAGLLATPSRAAVGPHMFINESEVERIRKNIATRSWAADAWSRLQADANAALRVPPAPVDPDGDYSADGRVNGSCPSSGGGWFCDLYTPGLRDGQNAFALALAWRIGGNATFAQGAKKILFAWVRTHTHPVRLVGHMVAEPIGPMIKLFITADLLRSYLSAAEFSEVQRWAAQWVAVGKRRADGTRDDPWVEDVTYNGMKTNLATYGNSPIGQRAMAVWAAAIVGGATLDDVLAWNWSHRTPHGHEYGWLDVIEHMIIPGTGGETAEGRSRQSVGYGLFAWGELVLIADVARHAGFSRDLFTATTGSGKSLLSVLGFYTPLLTGEQPYPYSRNETFMHGDYEDIKAHFRAVFEIVLRATPPSSAAATALERIVTAGGDGQRGANEDLHITAYTAILGVDSDAPDEAEGPVSSDGTPAHATSESFTVYGTGDVEPVSVPDVPQRLLLVALAGKRAGDAISSVTYDNRQLTRVLMRDERSVRLELWYLVDPPAGEASLEWRKDGNAENVVWGASVYSGVDQAQPFGGTAAASGSVAPSSNPSAVTVASSPGSLVVGAVVFNGDQASTGPASVSGQVSHWSRHKSTTQGATATESGAASVTLGWVPNGDPIGHWAAAAISLRAAA